MKEWNKPFMKMVVLDECDIVCTSPTPGPDPDPDPKPRNGSVTGDGVGYGDQIFNGNYN